MIREFVGNGTWTAAEDRLEGRVGPSGRPLMAVGESSLHPILHWNAYSLPNGSALLRFTVAIEDREPKRIQVASAQSGTPLGVLTADYPDPYQVIELPLSEENIALVQKEGVRLELTTGTRPLWFFAPNPTSQPNGSEVHLPHLLFPRNEHGTDHFLPLLCSLASVQSFSWKEGCVLDGLIELADHKHLANASVALQDHLDSFGFSRNELIYESPRNIRVENRAYGIEGTLPFAHAARINPSHRWVQIAQDFWLERLTSHGSVHDGHMISAEGAYTVAYPMALVGRLTRSEDLSREAGNLLRYTKKQLIGTDGIYLRHYTDGRRTFRNWSRGIAWYLLGHVQSLRHLEGDHRAELVEELNRAAAYVLPFQNEKGIWSCFIDSPEVLPDTAGSAGIAAAFAIGAREQLLPAAFAEAATRAYKTLSTYLTPDGFLNGCSQSNKAGEELQRGPYRVISPYALGLFGMLHAAVK